MDGSLDRQNGSVLLNKEAVLSTCVVSLNTAGGALPAERCRLNTATWMTPLSDYLASSTDVGPGNTPEFYRQFLPIVSRKMGAIGVVAWDCSSVPYRMLGHFAADPQPMPINLSEHEHQRLLQKTNAGEQAVLFVETGSGDSQQTIALSAIERDGIREVIEVVFDQSMDEQRRRQIGSSLTALCRAAASVSGNGSLGDGHPAPDPITTPSLLKHPSLVAIDRFIRAVHRCLDLTTTCYSIANELQAVVDCDRVSVYRRVGKRFRAIALSGQSELAARSNLIKTMERFTASQALTGNERWYPARPGCSAVDAIAATDELADADHVDGDNRPADRQELAGSDVRPSRELADYLHEARPSECVVVPFLATEGVLPDDVAGRSASGSSEPPKAPRSESRRVIGGVLLEQFGERSFQDRREGLQLLATHAGSAFANALAHESLPFFGLVNRLGKLTDARFRSRRIKWLVGFGIAALLILALFLVPTSYKVTADGVLVPGQRRSVFAAVEGEVQKIHVEHGSTVQPGDILLEMTSNQLELDVRRLQGSIDTSRQQIDSINQAKLKSNQRGVDPAQTALLDIEREKLAVTLEALEQQLAIARQRQEQLVVRSPIAGRVLSWQLKTELEDRPVVRGQKLLEIGALEGSWQLEVNVPDKDAGQVITAADRSDGKLTADFILISQPGKSYQGDVAHISMATTQDPNGGQVLKLHVNIDPEKLDYRQVRTDVRARIHCGTRSLGYVWTHEFIEFVQSQILFRLF